MIPAPYECLHTHRMFISREVGLNRKIAYVCPDCGQFVVSINGVEMAFVLASDEQVLAAGVYTRRLAELGSERAS